mmetsp:Transcript_16751/g.52064  ORF Transcript_16751/g.52064 Transcript_16751/m.52064 type:complete len:229 (+) Transcript_16751:1058-1744(+)
MGSSTLKSRTRKSPGGSTSSARSVPALSRTTSAAGAARLSRSTTKLEPLVSCVRICANRKSSATPSSPITISSVLVSSRPHSATIAAASGSSGTSEVTYTASHSTVQRARRVPTPTGAVASSSPAGASASVAPSVTRAVPSPPSPPSPPSVIVTFESSRKSVPDLMIGTPFTRSRNGSWSCPPSTRSRPGHCSANRRSFGMRECVSAMTSSQPFSERSRGSSSRATAT